MSDRSYLVKVINERLISEFHRRGFSSVLLTVEEKGTAVEESFPFGRLRRKRGDEFDLVEVQLNNRKKNAFRVNFAVISDKGIDHVVGHVKAEDVWAHYLDHYCELYRNPTLRTWFSPRWIDFRSDVKSKILDAVTEAVELLPEIDAFFLHRRKGRHVRCV